jgi:aminomethyltransferase
MKERGTARHGYNIVGNDGSAIGVVTSGSLGPTVGMNIGLGYVPTALAQPGTRLQIDCRGKGASAEVVQGPFYTRAKPGKPGKEERT